MKGLTLIECLIVLAVISLLAMFSLPFADLYGKHELKSVRSELKNMISLGKLSALRTGQTYRISGLHGDQNWSAGVKLCKKIDINRYQTTYQRDWKFRQWSIVWEGFQSKAYLSFYPCFASGVSNGTFVLQNKKTGEKKYLYLNRLGRLRE